VALHGAVHQPLETRSEAPVSQPAPQHVVKEEHQRDHHHRQHDGQQDEGHGGGTEDVEVWDTRFLTSFSIDGEYASISFSEATQSLSNGLRGGSNGRVLQKPYRGLSRLVFDLLSALASTVSSCRSAWVLERRSETLESILVALFFGRLR
jgi:hypothetical protein